MGRKRRGESRPGTGGQHIKVGSVRYWVALGQTVCGTLSWTELQKVLHSPLELNWCLQFEPHGALRNREYIKSATDYRFSKVLSKRDQLKN